MSRRPRSLLALPVAALLAVGAVLLTGCDVTATEVAVADAFVDADTPTTTYGTTSQLVVDAAPLREAYVQFDLTDQKNTVIEARLRLHVANVANAGSPDGGSVARVTGGWTEGDVTHATRPTTWGPTVGEIGAVTANTWVDITVTRAVTVGGVVTLGIRSDNTDGAYYDSRETGANAPQLIITTGAKPAAVTGTTVAAVGDAACAPSGAVTATTCRQAQVSDRILADPNASQLLALGDLQYETGALTDFQSSYDATYGRLKSITHPAIGNHEYGTSGGAGYFAYFGTAAGDPAKGYYSYDIGTAWHVVVLNSNCGTVSCAAGSAQEQWLRADLAASGRPCTMAVWHHPRFTSGTGHTNDPAVAPFWDALQAAGADVVLNGHVHDYERFAPQLPDQTPSPKGIQEFVVGTGGKSMYEFAAAQPNSRVRLLAFGYLDLVLGDKGWSWQFIDEAGATRDAGSAACH